jgi:plastocyanin domain-containing protein
MKLWIYGLGILILIVASGFFMFGKGSTGSVVDNPVQQRDGKVQQVVLSMKDLNYYPQEIRVKEGQPVSITLDSSVQGCLRSFTIRELGVHGLSTSPSETIDFTPTKKGVFKFMCSMGMGYGKLIVE